MIMKSSVKLTLILFFILWTFPLRAQMTIDGSGNIGIGTDAPNCNLDVDGTVNMTTLSINSTPVTTTAAELNHVDGVTSPIQAQLDGKAATASPIFTGSVTLPGVGTWDHDGKVGIGTHSPEEKLTLDHGNFLQKASLPVHIGSIADDGETSLDSASAICISGKFAYVTASNGDGYFKTSGDNGVEIIDISDPENPTHVGAIFESNVPATTALAGACSIQVSGNYAYVASSEDDGIEILDISNPSDPTHAGSITDSGLTELDGACSIYVSGKYAYVAAYADDGVEIIDISDPTSPTHIGALDDDVTTNLDGACSIYVSGKYAYVACKVGHGITIIDVSDPYNPSYVGKEIFNEYIYPRAIYVSGRYAYVSVSYNNYPDDLAGIAIIDISDPADPVIIGSSLDTIATTFTGSIVVAGSYAYQVTSGNIKVYDISNPASPHYFVGSGDSSETLLSGAMSMVICGKYAYIASCIDNGVEILDISGIDVPAAHIGSIATNTLNISENAQVGNNLNVNGSLNIGSGGLKSDGPVSIKDVLTLVPRASAPANPVAGSMYYGTNGKLYIHNGTTWNIFSPDPS